MEPVRPFGSDELTPYTAEYAWNSNQMAHVMMGFCIAVCWLLFALSLTAKSATPAPDGCTSFLRRALDWLKGVALIWFVVLLFASIPLKEVADLMLDGAKFADSVVSPNTKRLVFDSVTDISFWWTGMFLAAMFIGIFVRKDGKYRVWAPAIGLVACIAFWYFLAADKWLDQKRTFDKSNMPFNYTRLAVLAGEGEGRTKVHFADESKIKWPELESFRKDVVDADRPAQQHYVLIGGLPDVRSRLAVGMGCEYALKIRPDAGQFTGDELVRIRYLSAATALERPKLLEETSVLKNLECVVIDHLDVSMARPSEAQAETYFRVKEQVATKIGSKTASVPRRVVDNLKAPNKNFIPDPKNPETLQVPLDELAALKKAAIEQQRAEALKAVAPKLQSERLAAIQQLGKKASLGQVSTIWVLTGFDGAKDPQAKAEWTKRKDGWVDEIAEILEVKRGDLRIVELKEPPEALR